MNIIKSKNINSLCSIVVAVLIVLSASSGGSSTNNSQSITNEDIEVKNTVINHDSKPVDTSAEYFAYLVYKQICPDSTVTAPAVGRDEEDKHTFIRKSEVDEETVIVESVTCLPKNGGGYVAFYGVEEESIVGDGGIDYMLFKAYTYIDGKVVEDKEILPKPSFDDFCNVEPLWFYKPDDPDFTNAKKRFNPNYVYYIISNDGILKTFITGEYSSDFALSFKFNGDTFHSIESDDLELGFINENGLGEIRLGDIPPNKLPGFDINTVGHTMFYNHNGKKEFKISLSDDGKIDTITVYSLTYCYKYWFAGGFNSLGVGSVLDSEVADNLYNYVHDGNHSYIKNNGSIIEFYCGRDNEIQFIKIYKDKTEVNKQIWHLLIKEHKREGDNNPLLNYDDREDSEYEDNKTEDGVNIYNPGAESSYVHVFKSFPLIDGSVKVYEYVAWLKGNNPNEADDEATPTSFNFYSYVFDEIRNGTLMRVTLEPEIAAAVAKVENIYTSSPAIFTENNGLKIDNDMFIWNGKRFVKQE
ncbi:MAG: hypothetical protein IKQ46_07620 [Bacteroidales bacterium]|nr:hypothetical protein [Bacteroidales bacterium]